MKGAAATAAAIWLARLQTPADAIAREITARFGYGLSMTVDGSRPTCRHDETCQRSELQALMCALEATDFENAIRNAISIAGNSDTLAAIAGSVAEPRFGVGMPDHFARAVWVRLPEDLRRVLGAHMRARTEALQLDGTHGAVAMPKSGNHGERLTACVRGASLRRTTSCCAGLRRGPKDSERLRA